MEALNQGLHTELDQRVYSHLRLSRLSQVHPQTEVTSSQGGEYAMICRPVSHRWSHIWNVMRIGALPKILTKTRPASIEEEEKPKFFSYFCRIPRLHWHRLSNTMRRNPAYTKSFYISGLLRLPPTVKAEANISAARRVEFIYCLPLTL